MGFVQSKMLTIPIAWPFLEPVDPVELCIPDYFDIIKNPMDLGTITKKLLSGKYANVDEFTKDVRLVWNNCFTYNQPGSDVFVMAETLSKLFEEKLKKLKVLMEEAKEQQKIQEIKKIINEKKQVAQPRFIIIIFKLTS